MLSKESLKDLYIIISDLNDGGEQYWGSSKDFELEAEIFFELKEELEKPKYRTDVPELAGGITADWFHTKKI